MTEQDNILRLAREAGFFIHDRKQQARVGIDCITGEDSTEKLSKFAALVKAEAVAETREACAGVAHYFKREHYDMAGKIERAIRAMAATPSREGEA